MTMFNYMEIFRKKSEYMHIFNVSITTVQGLKNVSLKVWEELITQSRYPIEDASPPRPAFTIL